MSMATRPETQAPEPHAADSHDLIRVHGARENNLKDVSIEIPKRRLTVFTGVSGSGKSSLVFGTIAAESQRLINETYSAFVQGFMPTLSRPEVDVLEGLTTAIIVDQQRMGADPRSTVGTATDANAMLRILFSRLGQPHIGSPKAFSFNVPSISGARRGHPGARREDRQGAAQLQHHRRDVPAVRGPGHHLRHRPHPAVRRVQVAQGGRDHRSRLHRGRLELSPLHRVGLLRPGQAGPRLHQEGAARLPVPRAGPDEDRGHQHDIRGPGAPDPEIDAVEGPGRDAAAHPGVRGAGGDLQRVPGVRGDPAGGASQVVEDQGDQHCRRVRDGDPRSCRMDRGARRAVGSAAARHSQAHPRLVHGNRAWLPLARPGGGHAVRRRGAARQDDPPARLLAHRRHLRLRRADDRAASP